MANHKATKKSIIQTKVKNLRNKSIKSKIHTFTRDLEEKISNKDKDAANISLKNLQVNLMKAVSKNIFKIKTASRKLSRLNKKIKSL